MTDDIEDINETHPFGRTMREESYVDPGEQAWLAWVKKAERLAGHDLDGNQDEDGYSLDFAYDAWRRQETPEQYVASIQEGTQ